MRSAWRWLVEVRCEPKLADGCGRSVRSGERVAAKATHQHDRRPNVDEAALTKALQEGEMAEGHADHVRG
jgi:hypothetical protein